MLSSTACNSVIASGHFFSATCLRASASRAAAALASPGNTAGDRSAAPAGGALAACSRRRAPSRPRKREGCFMRFTQGHGTRRASALYTAAGGVHPLAPASGERGRGTAADLTLLL